MTILIIIVAPIAGKASDRIGSRWLMGARDDDRRHLAAPLPAASGSHSTFWTLLPAMLLGGVGMAMTMSPMTSAAMGSVPVDKAGVGSGVLNSFRQMGGSLGIALMGAIVASYLHAPARSPQGAQQFVDGLHAALLVSAGITFAAAGRRDRARADDARRPSGRTSRRWPRDDGDAPAGGGASPRARRDRDPRLHGRQLPRHDDRRDRPRGRRVGADPLPALRVEARPLSRRARPRVERGAHPLGGGDRRRRPTSAARSRR